MGLAVRIIPTLLCRGRQLVKGKQFNSWRSVGMVAQAVRIHQARGVDELVLLDIGVTPEGRGPDLALVEELTAGCFMPLTIGGGVRSVFDVRDMLTAGADKVVIGRAAWIDTSIVRRAADMVGSQAIVVTVDVVAERNADDDDDYRPGVRCMLETAPWRARWMEQHGAGEILLTSIDREGTMEGYDLALIRAVSGAVSIPVIAHGGCSGYQDMVDAVHAGASAVAAGALFQFSDCTPREAAQYLSKAGIEARVL